jgi:hypothetical protein
MMIKAIKSWFNDAGRAVNQQGFRHWWINRKK